MSVSAAECRRIADFLGVPYGRFLDEYTHYRKGLDRWLIDAEGNDIPCIFLRRTKNGPATCAIEEVKPDQCRDFPALWTRSDASDWCEGLKALAAERETSDGG